MAGHGEIYFVHYEKDEHAWIASLKKLLVGTLSNKLYTSKDALDNQKRWGYKVNETHHDGQYFFHIYTYLTTLWHKPKCLSVV